MKTLYVFLLCLYTSLTVAAQPLCQIKHFSVNSGLSQGVVVNIMQDKKGFLWFATWNGLNKFDGYTFKNYKAFPGDGCTLTTNRFSYITESKDGDIWCKSYDNRAYLFDIQTEKFIDILLPIESSLQQTNTVSNIYTLNKGITWITCEQGYAFRINEQTCKEGKDIILYSSFNQNLKGNKIFDIYEDSDGDEWIMTDKGVTIIGKKRINSDYPFKMVKEYNKRIYLISTSGKIAIYDPKNGNIKFQELPCPVTDIYSISSISPSNDKIGLGTDNGFITYDTEKKKFQHFNIQTATQPSNEAHFFYQDKTGEVWIFANTSGVIKLNLKTGDKQHFTAPIQNLIQYERDNRYMIFEDHEGTLWMSPQKGHLCYYDRDSNQLKLYFADENNPASLFAPSIRYYYTDRQQNVWITNDRGVDKISFYPNKYKIRPIDNGLEIRAFLADKQKRLWVASKKGNVRIYRPDGTLEGYLSPQGIITPQEVTFGKSVYCFMEDKQGNIWMGTKKDGLILLKKKNEHSYLLQQFVHQPQDTYSLSNNSVYSIIQDSHDNIWIACYGGGLNLLSHAPDGSTNFIHSGNRLKNYPVSTSLKIRHIAEAPNGVLLIGTTNGLLTFSNKFDQPEEIKFYHSNRIPNVDSSLSSNDVMQIFTDSRKNTYVITFTGGISQVISKNLLTEDIQFKSYTIKDGLASDLVLSMLEDTQKQLWVISENSISKFNPQQGTFENYGSNYFQRELNLTEAVPTLTSQKKIVLGTNQGILEINTEQMKKSSYVPPIVFTGLKIQGSQLHVALDDIKELELNPSERNVTFQFAAIDYVNPDAIEYAYRLQGLEEEWNEAGNNRSATYINLPAGEYQLQIRSSNSDGVWTDNIRTLPIHVLPTFWETYWAWLFYIVMFVLFTTIIVYILFYIYRLRHQVDLEQHLSNIKLRFFTDISHELRTPLTLISSPVSEILAHEAISPTVREHLNLVHKNTERMLRLVNQLLDFRKIQNKKMKVLVEKTELVSQLQKIMESFHLIAKEKRIDFQLQTNTDKIYAWVDRDKFEKIFFNLLSNAFKYTPNGKKVTVNMITGSEQVTISVSDEGIGIAPEKQQSLFYRFETLAQYNILQPSSGIGLSLVRELIELHHGNIQVKSEPGSGSEFIVTLPKEEKAFADDQQAEFILSDSDNNSPTIQATEEDSDSTSFKAAYAENENKTDAEDEKTSILIVEDNNELRHFLWNILSETYTVLEATNGKEGLKYAQQYIPDLIISDVMMPVMDGLDMVKAIKADHNTCHIPIILLSAKSSLDDRIAGLEQGIDDYITKPFSSTYLKTKILSLLRQRKQLQDLYLSKLSEHTQEEDHINGWEPSQPQVTPYDEQFMQQVMAFMEEQMDNTDITIDDFANKLMLSRTVFYRKLKSIVGLTPVDFVCEMRIKRAAQLIEKSEYSFSQIAYMTGFNDPKYFSRRFKKIMGVTPTEYKERKGDAS